MKSTFGPNDCHLLCINSSQDGEMEHQDNPWASYVSTLEDCGLLYFYTLTFTCIECYVILRVGVIYWTK